MRILHLPFTFHPDPAGGTEIYVAALAEAQSSQGHDAVIAAPGKATASYSHHGIPVHRYPVNTVVDDVREMYGEGCEFAERGFLEILDDEQPDLVHMHALTRGVSVKIAKAIKRRNIPLVFSYHTPTVTCQRGSLIEMGESVCDGVLDAGRCAACALEGAGLNKIASTVAGALPERLGRTLGTIGLSGGAWTAARMTELVSLRHAAFRSLIREVDHFIALAGWVRDVLVRNGVPQDKITVSRQGLCQHPTGAQHSQTRTPNHPLKLIFLGRFDPLKGVHILLEAMKAAPEIPITLDIYGVAQGAAGFAYRKRLEELASGDHRISFCDPVPSSDVVGRISEYDALAVPSQCIETGPLVVLESFAASVPVIGANLGGIAEFVHDGVDGLLVEFNCVESWIRQLRRFAEDPELRARLRSGIRAPRTMDDVAMELAAIYSQVSEPAIA